MILYPAIDIKDGEAVRLLRGDMQQSTVFNTDPVAQAKEFFKAGCEWLHLVDLNGACLGAPVNACVVEKIVMEIKIPVQLGGGIRNMHTLERWFEIGLSRVILGTVAVENPTLVKEAAKEFPGKVAVGIDARDGLVATQGWTENSKIEVNELAKSFQDAGVGAIIFTDIDRDGLMKGLNSNDTKRLSDHVSIPVIGSGGINGPENLENVKKNIPNFLKISDWRQLNPSLFNALEVEKNVMFLILLLIIIVAAFNLISSMIILVSMKRKDIGVLRILGVKKNQILKIFIINGSIIGVLGTIIGCFLGLIFCTNINEIKSFIELFLDSNLFSEEIYFFSQLPVIINYSQILKIASISIFLSFLSTIYPSIRASKVDPINLIKWD